MYCCCEHTEPTPLCTVYKSLAYLFFLLIYIEQWCHLMSYEDVVECLMVYGDYMQIIMKICLEINSKVKNSFLKDL